MQLIELQNSVLKSLEIIRHFRFLLSFAFYVRRKHWNLENNLESHNVFIRLDVLNTISLFLQNVCL